MRLARYHPQILPTARLSLFGGSKLTGHMVENVPTDVLMTFSRGKFAFDVYNFVFSKESISDTVLRYVRAIHSDTVISPCKCCYIEIF